jgi:hypothetical protein
MEVRAMPIFKKNVPIPPSTWSTKGTRKYKWLEDWQVGDCIEVTDAKEIEGIRNAVSRHGFKGHKGKISQRAVNENGQNFYRIWRVA